MVHPAVDRLASYSWRLLTIIALAVAVIWFIGQVWPALLPLVVAVLLGRVLWGPNLWLRSRGAKPGLAAAASMFGFFVALALVLGAVGLAVADEFDDLGPALSEGVDDVENWLVEDSPFDVDHADVDRFRQDIGDAIGDAVRSSGDSLVDAALIAGEVFIAVVLGVIVTFFLLKDGNRFAGWVQGLLPGDRRGLADVLGVRAWKTLGGYLRGAATLGTVEGIAIAIALTLVGAELAVPMAVVTFLAAFVPFIGATAAGILAVLVALGTAGPVEALIIAVVAFVIQQIDNELLAPVVYGRSLELHPVLILLGVVAGGALFGVPGSVLAVPVVALAANVGAEAVAYQRGARTGRHAGLTGEDGVVARAHTPAACSGIGRTASLRQCGRESSAGRDAELDEHLAEVPLDRASAQEQLGCDLGVRTSVACRTRDVFFL